MNNDVTGVQDAGLSNHGWWLDTLARADGDAMKAMAEYLLPGLGDIDVVQSRTGLVMLPLRDTVADTDFHLGEVLVAEAHIRLPGTSVEGYGMVTGRDLERAMAVAVIDAAAAAGKETDRIAQFIQREAERIRADDDARLRAVEATRVDMETF
ncbi:phosphonate C-P lyase system protein PhnG [Rhizobium sp. RU36D]|uniref:phosphonate C-P lyase system protein PhnG n=1 Tax=Rhizobium sp. RU36D TaxID=1907415 RepID=UPI0009D8A7F3|nr:phosphonate C-P lyase system protein PhnG [Rhizobium sp. RU36D]SMC70693.1 alpha-D-ribose 1-methylphosphonate 5-triphosphate synthase subunit PhnG [Rhizobium sp. RU36D]